MGEKTGEGKAGRGTRGVVDGEREGKTKAPKRKEQCALDRILTPARALAEPPPPHLRSHGWRPLSRESNPGPQATQLQLSKFILRLK